ncbi:MAG TPA: SRPBCC domain-containing protein [Caulobacteraceae bacterium]
MGDERGIPVWTYERRFVFDLPLERAWALFTDPAETRAWLLPFEENDDGEMQATIDGQKPVEFSVLEIDRHRRIVSAMSGGNVPGRVETTTAFAETGKGSEATMTHRGYGDAVDWERFGGSFAAGWDEATTDLMAYVRTGVKLPRHIDDHRASIAAWPVRRDWGIELVDVFPGGFADQTGMKAGDILLKLGRMGVYSIADVWAFTRARAAGEEVEAAYIRDRSLHTGMGRLSRFEDFGE